MRKSKVLVKIIRLDELLLLVSLLYWALALVHIDDVEANLVSEARATTHAATREESTAGWEFDEPKDSLRSPASVQDRAKVSNHAQGHSNANHSEGVSPEIALRELKQGNLRFVQGRSRKQNEGISAKDRERLAQGQHPRAILVSCSDSRVPPEIVLDQRLGEIFVVRSAGQSLDSSAIASIEYAVAHLGARLILVMGHDRCGAVKAALEAKAGTTVGSPHLDALVADIQPRIASERRSPASTNVVVESLANARGAVRDLRAKSKIVRDQIDAGKLEVRSALYHLDTGAVDFD